jgi:hypothetical protein
MSDAEEKKSGYRLEYAKNNRAKCKGTFSSQLFLLSILLLIVARVLRLSRAETLLWLVVSFLRSIDLTKF